MDKVRNISPIGQPPGFLLRVSQFARLLRDNGFSVSPDNAADAVQVLSEDATMPSKHHLREILAVLFCHCREDIARFDEIFNAYWLNSVGQKRTLLREMGQAAQTVVEKNSQDGGSGIPEGLANYFDWRASQNENDEDQPESEEEELTTANLGGASGGEARSKVDLGKVTDPEEAEALLAFAERLGRQMRFRISRRLKPSVKGQAVDMRRSLKKTLGTGGLPVTLVKKTRRKPPISLVIFVDVSGSMDAYSLFFTRFMQALLRGFRGAHAFLFHTRLVYVSDVFKEARSDVLMDKLGLIGQGWSGGTQLGSAFGRFNRQYGKKMGGSRSIALLMSDGYDAGDPDVLQKELHGLKRHCRKLIWLNPLLGRESYAPENRSATQLMAAADLTIAAHNLASLQKLERVIANA